MYAYYRRKGLSTEEMLAEGKITIDDLPYKEQGDDYMMELTPEQEKEFFEHYEKMREEAEKMTIDDF